MKNSFLIIDDDKNFVTTLQIDLETEGYKVKTVTNPLTGLREAKRLKPDIILLDWEMPSLTGIEITRQIKRDDSLCMSYIIMLTGRTNASDVVKALDAGADDFLKKPFSSEELKARIRVGLRIRRLEEQISSNAKLSAQSEMALLLADKIGNPIAAAKLYQQSLTMNTKLFKSNQAKETINTLGKLLNEALELINSYQEIKSQKKK